MYIILVVSAPLKNDGVRQLRLWNSRYMESHKIHVPNHQPVIDAFLSHEPPFSPMFLTTNQSIIFLETMGSTQGALAKFISCLASSSKACDRCEKLEKQQDLMRSNEIESDISWRNYVYIYSIMGYVCIYIYVYIINNMIIGAYPELGLSRVNPRVTLEIPMATKKLRIWQWNAPLPTM